MLGRYSNHCDQGKRIERVLEIALSDPVTPVSRPLRQVHRRLRAGELDELVEASHAIGGLTCPFESLCFSEDANAGMEVSTTLASGRANFTPIGGAALPMGVSCPTIKFCAIYYIPNSTTGRVNGETSQFWISTQPSNPASWKSVPFG